MAFFCPPGNPKRESRRPPPPMLGKNCPWFGTSPRARAVDVVAGFIYGMGWLTVREITVSDSQKGTQTQVKNPWSIPSRRVMSQRI